LYYKLNRRHLLRVTEAHVTKFSTRCLETRSLIFFKVKITVGRSIVIGMLLDGTPNTEKPWKNKRISKRAFLQHSESFMDIFVHNFAKYVIVGVGIWFIQFGLEWHFRESEYLRLQKTKREFMCICEPVDSLKRLTQRDLLSLIQVEVVDADVDHSFW